MIPPQTPTSPAESIMTDITSFTNVSNKTKTKTRDYYLKYKDKTITCECGQIIKKVSRSAHIKTNKHIINMDIIKQQQANEMIQHEEYFTKTLNDILYESQCKSESDKSNNLLL
jgi:hypothetical protein